MTETSRQAFKRLTPGIPPEWSRFAEAQAFIQRQAFAEWIVALVAEFPEVRAELRRLLMEEPSAERGRAEDPSVIDSRHYSP